LAQTLLYDRNVADVDTTSSIRKIMTKKLMLIELNELNFRFIEAYARQGLMPNFARLVAECGLRETTSETAYEELEPWIQWVTAHTGLSYAKHRVFRLGDIVYTDLPQIWEELEADGYRVGAMSPMNAKCRVRNPVFFVPDPWTSTDVKAPAILRMLYSAIRQLVNDNAQKRITFAAAAKLMLGFVRYADPCHYARYLGLLRGVRSAPWRRALVLDLLLADAYVRIASRDVPDFASLFLNAGAHIQHHYMFSSSVYEGDASNPAWYVSKELDPVREVYELYDHLLGQIMGSFPNVRFVIATGLHQDPHQELTYYWRLRAHAGFLKKHGCAFTRFEPRMSRDFLVCCGDAESAARTAGILREATVEGGVPLFEVDVRGLDMFVTLSYPREITPLTMYKMGGRDFADLHSEVAFVAIKNGQHNGVGYLIDTGLRRAEADLVPMPLAALPDYIKRAVAA
jgi:hypothetical protein